MKLGEAVSLRKKNTIDIEDDESYEISGIQNYGKGVVVRRKVLGQELTMRKYQVIEPDQLMWCKVDTKNGAFGVTHDDHAGTLASGNMALADIHTDVVDPQFLETLFRIPAFAEHITKLSSGTTNRKYLTPKDLLIQVELPDLDIAEQKDFVTKLKTMEELSLEDEITHQHSLLGKLKQAILQEAIQGKLTADWRAANPVGDLSTEASAKVEPASELLQRIQVEKARLIAEKKIRKEKPLPEITPEEIPFEIPDGWEWCRLGNTAIEAAYGTSQKAHLEPDGVPVLRMGNVTLDGHLTLDSLKYVSPDIKDLPRLYLESGDLVFNRTNSLELVGKSAVFREESPFTLASYLIRVRLFTELSPEYFAGYLNSTVCRTEFIEPGVIQQNGQANFNGTKLKNIPVPLPPLAEQAAIVERVEALMATCRELEAEIERSRTHAADLLQAVLKEAFAPAS